MFVKGSNRKEFEIQGVNYICLHMSAVREMVAPIYKHLFVLTYSHLYFNVGLPPSFSLTEQQHRGGGGYYTYFGYGDVPSGRVSIFTILV